MSKKVVLITGASSGMGYQAAKYFAKKGFVVYAGARHVEPMEDLEDYGINIMALDVTNEESVRIFVNTAKTEQQRIDVLINNAGFGEFGSIEDVSIKKAKAEFDVNLFGVAQVSRFVLPIMRHQHFGRIINVSSIASEIYMPLGGWYQASKAALNTLSDTLDSEVRQFGIRSIIVEPGGTKTNWTKKALKSGVQNSKSDPAYLKMMPKVERLLNISARNTKPVELARLFYQAAIDKKPKFRYFNRLEDQLLVGIVRHLPRTYRMVLREVFKKG